MPLVGVLLSACVGTIERPGESPSQPTPTPTVDPGVFADLPTGPFHPAPAGLRRLTTPQYLQSVQDLLGAGLTLPTNLEPDTLVDGLSAIGATEVPISARGVELYDQAARALTEQVFTDDARRRALVGCAPADPTCVRGFLSSFGRRAWRRALEPTELDRYVALSSSIASAFADPWKGLEYATSALLESPNFLHRAELGSPDAAHPGWTTLQGDALASRLSFFLWGTLPDEALLAAAARGELDQPAGLRAQVERLVASPRLRPSVLTFFGEHFGLNALDGLQRDPVRYPSASSALAAAMRGEWERNLAEFALDPQADFRGVLTTSSSWTNALVAPLYQLAPPADGFVKQPFPAGQSRGGLFGWSGVLAATSHPNRSSPTARGVFVRRKVLCATIPPPPPNVVTTIDNDPNPTLTLRQRLEAHRANPACAGCHGLFDPIGLGLENYDALGTYRTVDEQGQAIDATGSFDGAPFVGAAALGALVHDNPRFSDCVVRHLYSHAVGHAVAPGEAQTVRTLASDFAGSGYRVIDLLAAIAQSDGFRSAEGQR